MKLCALPIVLALGPLPSLLWPPFLLLLLLLQLLLLLLLLLSLSLPLPLLMPLPLLLPLPLLMLLLLLLLLPLILILPLPPLHLSSADGEEGGEGGSPPSLHVSFGVPADWRPPVRCR